MNLSKVAPKDEGTSLKNWLKANKGGLPRALIEKGLRKGWIKVNGKKADLSHTLHAGDEVGLSDHLTTVGAEERKEKSGFTKQELAWIDKAILYHDAEIFAINKPAGLAVQGGSGQIKSVDAMMAAWAGIEDAPRLVHRLDMDTSGVLVLARNAASAKHLAGLFATHHVEKTYLALIVGVPKQREGRIDMKLAKRESGKDSGMERVKHYEDGKDAVTEYKVVEHFANKLAWVGLKPITGRTHQLRVHMAQIGHPIVGDGKYGGTNAFVKGIDISPQMHLHAQSILIPRRGKNDLVIKAPLPPHMLKTKKELF